MAVPELLSTPDSLVAHYFAHLQATFEQARSRTGCRIDKAYSLAGDSIRLRFANESLARLLTPAFDHLPPARTDGGLEVLCCDADESGTPLPPFPWARPSEPQRGTLYDPARSRHFHAIALPDSDAIVLQRTDTGQAAFWVRKAARLPTYHLGSPLITILAAWTHTRNLILAHAGCVGTERGAALLVGKGGSGKSTTSLLCAEAGLRYLSDDYCVIRPGPAPVVHSLYNTGKLLRHKLGQFPRLAAFSHESVPDAYDKPVICMHRVPGIIVETQLPLRTVLVPVITGLPASSVERISAAHALRALAPSTIFQLKNTDPSFLRDMADVVRSVPCFRLNLGTDFAAIPQVVRDLLERL